MSWHGCRRRFLSFLCTSRGGWQFSAGEWLPTPRSRRRGPFNKQLYKLRAKVEQLINRLKQFRRVATRYEKRGDNYLGMVTLAAILLYL